MVALKAGSPCRRCSAGAGSPKRNLPLGGQKELCIVVVIGEMDRRLDGFSAEEIKQQATSLPAQGLGLWR